MKLISLALCFILLGMHASQLYEGTTDPYCSLRETQSECHANRNCMFIEIQLDETYGLEKKPITMCYHKDFIINSLKSTIFPANYDEISNKVLLEHVDLEPSIDLDVPSNIEVLVHRLIEQKKIKFIEHFKFLA